MYRIKLVFGHSDEEDSTLLGFVSTETWATLDEAKVVLNTLPAELRAQIIDENGLTVFHA